MIDILTGKPVKEIVCYKCGSNEQLLVQEKTCNTTGKVIEKQFICATCAWGCENEQEQKRTARENN